MSANGAVQTTLASYCKLSDVHGVSVTGEPGSNAYGAFYNTGFEGNLRGALLGWGTPSVFNGCSFVFNGSLVSGPGVGRGCIISVPNLA